MHAAQRSNLPVASPSTSPRSKASTLQSPIRSPPPNTTHLEQQEQSSPAASLTAATPLESSISYAFPSSSHRPSTLNPRTQAQRMLEPQNASLSGNSRSRSRRQAPLVLHEIQPPSRHLSAHQMLLLTPFGGVVPPGSMSPSSHSFGAPAGRGGPTDMAPEASTMSRSSGGAQQRHSIHHPDAFGDGSRWHHLSSGIPGPSPLAWSSPMTAIPSASEYGSGSEGPASLPASREPSNIANQDAPNNDSVQWTGATHVPGTVPMTRSNSLPVMTIRELEALKQKDGELGIVRGGDWAWVSSQQDETGELEEIPESSTENTESAESPCSATPPSFRHSAQHYTLFSDPFASVSSSSSMSREGAASYFPHDHAGQSTYTPTSTMAGYRYSPMANEARRMSEAPSTTHRHSPIATNERRPSAPAQALYLPLDTLPSHDATLTGVPSPGFVSHQRARPSASSLESPTRPRLTRYRSLPGRNEGFGLSILVRQPNQPATAPASAYPRGSTASAGTHSSGSDRRISDSSNGNAHRRRNGGSFGRERSSGGIWAAMDVVETLSLGDFDLESNGRRLSSTATSPMTATRLLHSFSSRPPSRRSSYGATHSRHSVSPTNQSAEIYLVEEIASRATHLTSVYRGSESRTPGISHVYGSGGNDGRSSIHSEPYTRGSGWDFTFPRRGSLAVLSGSSLGPWAVQLGVSVGVGETPHWSERRGSWAEGWRINR